MFAQFLEQYGSALDEEMRAVVDSFEDFPAGFRTMLQYPMGWVNADSTVYPGQTGKRIRPIVLLLCVEAAGGDWQRAISAAASVEILHNFSLVHDDIQDNSEARHGRQTVWRVWGQPMAINVGDAMFALAYHAMHKLHDAGYPPEVVLDVWGIFNETILHLTRGQYLDMHFETSDLVAVEEYLTMVEGKTASLLAGTTQIGSLLGSGEMSVSKDYAKFGLNLGLAFQIRDDILGIWGDPAATGKSAATDITARKKSLPVLYGLAQSADLRALYARTEAFQKWHVDQVMRALQEVGARDYAHDLEKTYFDEAMASLQRAQPQGDAAASLVQLVNALFGRAY